MPTQSGLFAQGGEYWRSAHTAPHLRCRLHPSPCPAPSRCHTARQPTMPREAQHPLATTSAHNGCFSHCKRTPMRQKPSMMKTNPKPYRMYQNINASTGPVQHGYACQRKRIHPWRHQQPVSQPAHTYPTQRKLRPRPESCQTSGNVSNKVTHTPSEWCG